MSPSTAFEGQEQFAARMAMLGVREEDIQETFVRSGGHGGQNVNKVSSCVQLVHVPSGIQVKCQSSRYQGENRILARRLLLDKLEHRREAQAAAQRASVEKARRQKRGRSRAAKARMLADKARHSVKKAFRRSSRGGED